MAKKAKRARKRLLKKPKETISRRESFDGIVRTKMRIVGIGGGGSNIVSEISQRLQKADFIAANTDVQALRGVGRNTKKFAFGQSVTRGLGCGMDAGAGQLAAQEDKEKIKNLLLNQDLCIFVATLGGGTGSGAAPVFAEVAQELKNLSIGIFTMPFSFEGEKRMRLAEQALEKLKPLLNAYVVIKNDRIFQIVDKAAPLRFALSAVNKKLCEGLEGFVETLFLPGLINIDFADVKALLQGRGRLAYLASIVSAGEERVKFALDQVLASPVYDYGSKNAERVLFNIAGSQDLKMDEVAKISRMIYDQNPKAKIILGISQSPKFQKKLRVTIFAVGCSEQDKPSKIVVALKAPKRKAHSKKQLKIKLHAKLAEKQQEQAVPQETKQRRNALEVKEAVDEEIEELQKKEKAWDLPAFLRAKKI